MFKKLKSLFKPKRDVVRVPYPKIVEKIVEKPVEKIVYTAYSPGLVEAEWTQEAATAWKNIISSEIGKIVIAKLVAEQATRESNAVAEHTEYSCGVAGGFRIAISRLFDFQEYKQKDSEPTYSVADSPNKSVYGAPEVKH